MVKQNGFLLGYAPEEPKEGKEVVLEKIKTDGSALKHVSGELKAKEKLSL